MLGSAPATAPNKVTPITLLIEGLVILREVYKTNMTEKVEPKKAGRPKGSLGRTKSKLRKTEASLMKMNDSAVEVIQRSLDGEKVDSGKLATAKWVVTTSVTVSRAAIAEETILNVDIPRASEEDEEDQYAAFSLTVVS